MKKNSHTQSPVIFHCGALYRKKKRMVTKELAMYCKLVCFSPLLRVFTALDYLTEKACEDK